jgi:hypothetical protein
MHERTVECARRLRDARWYVQRGTRCTADTACIAALRSAGVRVLRGGQGARASVEPAEGAKT